jgi:pantoate--beta-alanine ligase
MQTFVTRDEINQWRKQLMQDRRKLGFVPTMGALHKGHLSLIERASVENDAVLVSIFVNPKQFNQQTDLLAYPRMLDADIALLKALPNVFIFAPNETEMYPFGLPFEPMQLGEVGAILEGAKRPGHFDGVVHVVHHLFELIAPNRAYFGEKDFQQLVVIRKLNDYYQFGIEIIACPTERDPDGLAMSSRNLRLSAEERQKALSIFKALTFIKENTGKNPIETTRNRAIQIIEDAGLLLDYLEIVDPASLKPCKSWQQTQRCCVAAFCGEVRLIDNMLCESVKLP